MMFSVGQNVLYGTNGVCVVEDITEKKVGKVSMEYYVLKPLASDSSTLFVPTHNEELVKRIRDILNKDSIDSILANLPDIGEWNENKQERSDDFKSIIAGGDCVELIRMIRLIHAHSNELAEKEAEKMVSEEISLVLDVDKDTAIELILK